MNARICGTALLLSLIWTAGMHAKTTASTAEDDTDTAGSLDRAVVDAGDATRFSRVFDKGRRGEPITIGFIGGSITAGYAAHDAPHRYVDRVAAWFARIFPASQVKLINAGVGGTGSDFGALRVQADVLKQQPDVVVVEFAVNDEDNEHAGRTLEGVVRQVLSAPNAPACLLLFMSHDGRNAQAWHAKVGRHYGLPMVSYRDGLAAEIDAGRLKWADISPDDIHPNDRGHAIAARYITHLLDNLLTAMPRGATVPSSSLPTPLLSDLYANVETHDADTLRPTKADGWAYDPATRSWRADRPGSVIEFNTSGRGAALMYYRIHQDYGRAKVTVDGAHDQIADGWFAPTWGGYRHTSELATDLPPGEHTVRVELLADKAPQSSGHEFRILGLAALGVAASDSAGPVAYQWKNVPIGGGGYISGVFAHPTAPGLFYCKTDIGGAYRREGIGPWEPLNDWVDHDHWTLSGIESAALDPNDPDAVYLAVGTYTNSWSGPGAFLLSHDRGRSWKTVPMPFKMGGNEDGRNQGERLAVDPNDGRILVFGSRKNGVWKSSDRGQTWSRMTGVPIPADAAKFGTPFVVFDARSGQRGKPTPTIVIGCASPGTPLLRSIDGGQSWADVPNVPANLLPQRAAFGADGALLVTFGNAVGPNGVTAGAVYRLEADGNTWTDITPVKPAGGDTFGYSAVTVDVHDPNLLLVSTLDRWAKGDDIFRSRDGGRTWKGLRDTAIRDASAAPWITFGSPGGAAFGHWISSVALDPADAQHLIYITGWGMWESRDTNAADDGRPTHWTFAGLGIDEGVMTEVISPPSGAPVLSTLWDLDGFRHTDVARSPADGFFKPWTGRNTSIDFAEADPNLIVRVFGGQVLGNPKDAAAGGAVSSDNGRTWTLFASRPDGAVDGVVAMAADGGRIVWTPENGATVVSTDRGRTWTSSAAMPWNLAVVADRKNAKVFYALDPATGVLYASEDGAATFAVRHTLPPGEGRLKAAYDKAGRLWLARPTGPFRSNDGGRSFERVDGLDSAVCVGFGKPVVDHDAAAVYAAARAGGHFGIFRSDDDGRSWERVNDDAHQYMQIAAISGDPRVAGRVYLASRSRGLVRGDPLPR